MRSLPRANRWGAIGSSTIEYFAIRYCTMISHALTPRVARAMSSTRAPLLVHMRN
jgi:hypothetical protein